MSEALVDDRVSLCCEVKNIDDGETVKVIIYEHDDDGEHDHITDLRGEVQDGKVAIPWKEEYHEDDDDTNCAKEITEQGYTVPEYFFIAEYDGVESEKGKLLYVKGWVKQLIIDKKTKKPLVNTNCFFVRNGEIIFAKTDQEGYIKHVFEKIGNYRIII